MASNKELDALLQILSGEQTIIQRTDQKAFTLLSILGAFMVFFIVHFTKMQLDMVIFSLIMIYFPAAMGTIYFLVRVLIPRVRGAKEINDNPGCKDRFISLKEQRLKLFFPVSISKIKF